MKHRNDRIPSLNLTIVAEFAAPVKRIWDLYVDPRQLEKVWGPPSHPATFVEHELTVGARTKYFMTGPDGEKYAGYWINTLVEEPTRFCFDDGFADKEFKPNQNLPVSKNEFQCEEIDGLLITWIHYTWVSRFRLPQDAGI